MPPYPRAISTGVSGCCAYIYWLDQSAGASVALQTSPNKLSAEMLRRREGGGREGGRSYIAAGLIRRLLRRVEEKLANLGREPSPHPDSRTVLRTWTDSERSQPSSNGMDVMSSGEQKRRSAANSDK